MSSLEAKIIMHISGLEALISNIQFPVRSHNGPIDNDSILLLDLKQIGITVGMAFL